MGVISSTSPSGVSTSFNTFVTQGLVRNIPITLADTEQSHTFPALTKCFMLETRGQGKLKLAFDSGQSGVEYKTIYSGGFYISPLIGSASTTIFFQSPTAGLILELTSWT